MKLFDVIKKVGTGIVRNAVPGGNAIVNMVNAVLPDDKKLPAEATGRDIDSALASLPPEQRAEIESRELDVRETEIQQAGDTLRTMLETDAKSPHTTRPYIAKVCVWVLALTTVPMAWTFIGALLWNRPELAQSIADAWPFVLAVTGTFAALLRAYFGILRNESRDRLGAASGQPQLGGVASVVAGMFKR